MFTNTYLGQRLKKTKISKILTYRNWDYVLLRSDSSHGIDPTAKEQEEADFKILTEYVKGQAPKSKVGWHMAWAYPKGSTHKWFVPFFNGNQMEMYNKLVSVTKECVVPSEIIEVVIPVGTAIQNVRSANVAESVLHRDQNHLSYGYGRYVAGLMCFQMLTDISIDGITYVPDGISEELMTIAVEAVTNAYKEPFAVTQSAYHVKN